MPLNIAAGKNVLSGGCQQEFDATFSVFQQLFEQLMQDLSATILRNSVLSSS